MMVRKRDFAFFYDVCGRHVVMTRQNIGRNQQRRRRVKVNPCDANSEENNMVVLTSIDGSSVQRTYLYCNTTSLSKIVSWLAVRSRVNNFVVGSSLTSTYLVAGVTEKWKKSSGEYYTCYW